MVHASNFSQFGYSFLPGCLIKIKLPWRNIIRISDWPRERQLCKSKSISDQFLTQFGSFKPAFIFPCFTFFSFNYCYIYWDTLWRGVSSKVCGLYQQLHQLYHLPFLAERIFFSQHKPCVGCILPYTFQLFQLAR